MTCTHLWKWHHNQDYKNIHYVPNPFFPVVSPCPQATAELLSVTIGLLAFSRILYEWNHALYIFVWLLSHSIFTLSFIVVCQKFIPFNSWILVHLMDTPQFVYYSSCDGYLDCFQCWVLQEAAPSRSLCMNVSLG